jgi:hypothetical protein
LIKERVDDGPNARDSVAEEGCEEDGERSKKEERRRELELVLFCREVHHHDARRGLRF